MINIFSPSFKDYERNQRHELRNIRCLINGPEQVRPVGLIKEIHNVEFKQTFVDFLIAHWRANEMAGLIGNTISILNCKHCHTSSVPNNCVLSNINDNLYIPCFNESIQYRHFSTNAWKHEIPLQ